jgi:hypothetical protein
MCGLPTGPSGHESDDGYMSAWVVGRFRVGLTRYVRRPVGSAATPVADSSIASASEISEEIS